MREFLAAYAARNEAAAVSVFDPASSDVAVVESVLSKAFGAVGPITMSGIDFVSAQEDAGQVLVRVRFDIEAVDIKTGQPYSGFGKLDRSFLLQEVGGKWMIEHYMPAEAVLEHDLIFDSSAGDRARDVAAYRDLATPLLVQGLLTFEDGETKTGQFVYARNASDSAELVAQTIGDRSLLAVAQMHEGLMDEYSGEYDRALAVYQTALAGFRSAGDSTRADQTQRSIDDIRQLQFLLGEQVPDERPQVELQTGPTQVDHPFNAIACPPTGFGTFNGDVVATSDIGNTVKLWRISDGKLLKTLHGARGLVLSLAFSPDGDKLAAGSLDGTIRIWDMHTGLLAKTIDNRAMGITADYGVNSSLGVYSVAYDDIGRLAAAVGVAATDNSLGDATGRLIVISPDESVACSIPTPHILQSVAWVYGDNIAAGDSTGKITIWDADTGELVRTLSGHTAAVMSLVHSEIGNVLASGSEDGTARTWNPKTGECLHTYPHLSSPFGIALELGGLSLMTVDSDGLVDVWDTETGKLAGTLQKSRYVTCLTASTWTPLSSSTVPYGDPNTYVIGSAGTGGLVVWNEFGKVTQTVNGATFPVAGFAFSSDGKRLYTAGLPGAVWNLDDASATWPGAGLLGIGQSDLAAGRLIAYAVAVYGRGPGGVKRSTFIGVSDTQTYKLYGVAIPEGASPFAGSVALSPDGKSIAAALEDHSVAVYDVLTGKPLFAIPAAAREVRGLRYSPDGATLAVATTELALYDAATGAPDVAFNAGAANAHLDAVAFSADGSHVIAGYDFGGVDVLDRSTGSQIIELDGPAVRTDAVAISPDGSHITAGTDDGMLWTWDAASGEIVRPLRVHDGPITAIAYSPDGSLIGTSGQDGSVVLSSAVTDFPVATLYSLLPKPGTLAGRWIAITPQGYYTCSESADDAVTWRLPGFKLADFSAYSHTYLSPLVVRQALHGVAIAPPPLAASLGAPSVHILEPGPDERKSVTGDSMLVVLSVTSTTRLTRCEFLIDGRPIAAGGAKAIFLGDKDLDRFANSSGDARAIFLGDKDISPSPLREGTGAESGGAGFGQTTYRISQELPLPANHADISVSAVVTDQNGQIDQDGIRVHRPDVHPTPGNLYLVAVGVDKYRDPTIDLHCAAADARSVAAAFSGQKGRAFGNVYETVLTDDDATPDNIAAALGKLAPATPNDLVVVFLSGHGVTQDGKFYFAPHGVLVNDIPETCLPWQAVLDALAQVNAPQILLVDACHSGTKLESLRAASAQMVSDAYSPGRIVIAACRADEFAYEDARAGHGYFTEALLEALHGKASGAGGKLTVSDLLGYITDRVEALSHDTQQPWVPREDEFDLGTVVAR